MKFLVPTYGTEGDVRPMAALCQALIEAGHQAVLMADQETLGEASRKGIPVLPLSGDIRGVRDPSASIAKVVGQKHSVDGMAKALAAVANANASPWLREIVEAGTDCDALIVSGLASFVGHSAAEALQVPAIGAGFIPLSPTSDFASPFLPPAMVPGFLNRSSHRLANSLIWRAFSQATNRARMEVCGLPARKSNWTTHPMLYGVSPTLLPRPTDWPAQTFLCGQWTSTDTQWEPPTGLLSFLEAGEPPLYVGFGSMLGFDTATLTKQVVAAAEGRRVVLSSGWSDRPSSDLPGNFYCIEHAPHDWLLPRMSAAIHHGGSGTSHSVTRAGIPSVVVAFAGDQPFWGETLKRRGLCGPVLSGHRLSVSSLARSIAFAEGSQVRARAAELGERMRAENGLSNAVVAIEQVMSPGGTA